MTTDNYAPFKAAPNFTTDVFDENTLPDKLQKEHSLRAGTWGRIRVLEGKIRYVIPETGNEIVLDPSTPGIIRPEQIHHVALMGPVKMQVEFYESPPLEESTAG